MVMEVGVGAGELISIVGLPYIPMEILTLVATRAMATHSQADQTPTEDKTPSRAQAQAQVPIQAPAQGDHPLAALLTMSSVVLLQVPTTTLTQETPPTLEAQDPIQIQAPAS